MSDHISQGLRLGSTVIPGTEWIIRDDRAWWDLGDFATRQRAQKPDVLVYHWTAGEAGARTADDDGPFIYNVMRNRPSNKLPPPAKLQVSIHFVVGADGRVWQTMDPLTCVAIHVGDTSVNSRSVGVEVVNPGTGPMVSQRPRPRISHRMFPSAKMPKGRTVRQLAFYTAQLDAVCALGELLALHLPIPRQVPGGADGELEIDRFTRDEQRRWRGAQEHFHVHSTLKVDAGTQCIRALHERAGWPIVQP